MVKVYKPDLCCIINPVNYVSRNWHEPGEQMQCVRPIYKSESRLFCRECLDLPENKKWRQSTSQVSLSFQHPSNWIHHGESNGIG